MKLIRSILSAVILAWDRLFTPKSPERSAEDQKRVDAEAARLKLYEFEGCPFCVKVRRELKRRGVPVERRDVLKNPAFEAELRQGGGEIQVPCLRIEKDDGSVQWMYESSAINAYLAERFPVAS